MKKLWYSLLTLVFGIILIVFFLFLQKDPNLATAILAFATVILAIATLLSIVNTNEQEKHRREDELQKEQRDKEERLLNEIIEWAEDIEKSATMRRKPERDELWDARQKYLSSKAMSDYMKQIASCFTGLSDNLVDVITLLDETTNATEDALSVSTPSGKPNTENLIPKEKRLREQIVVLTQAIANIKTGDIGKEEENMPKEGEAPGGKEPTLKDIEEHLKRQDKQTAKGVYLTGAAVGASIILVAVSLWVGKFVSSLIDFYWNYIFLLLVGFGFMCWCWWKQSKIK